MQLRQPLKVVFFASKFLMQKNTNKSAFFHLFNSNLDGKKTCPNLTYIYITIEGKKGHKV